MTMSGNQRGPLFGTHPVTGVSIEVFYADTTLATFGRGGIGWFWQVRQRGYAPDGLATGPFPTSYSAFRDVVKRGEPIVFFGRRSECREHDRASGDVSPGRLWITRRRKPDQLSPTHGFNADTVRTPRFYKNRPWR